MSKHEKPHPGPTPPRGWRPGPKFILAAIFAIVLIVVWQVLLASGPSNGVEPLPRTATTPVAPSR